MKSDASLPKQFLTVLLEVLSANGLTSYQISYKESYYFVVSPLKSYFVQLWQLYTNWAFKKENRTEISSAVICSQPLKEQFIKKISNRFEVNAK